MGSIRAFIRYSSGISRKKTSTASHKHSLTEKRFRIMGGCFMAPSGFPAFSNKRTPPVGKCFLVFLVSVLGVCVSIYYRFIARHSL